MAKFLYKNFYKIFTRFFKKINFYYILMSNWCTIESSPSVFTEMIEKFGLEGVEVSDVLVFDENDP